MHESPRRPSELMVKSISSADQCVAQRWHSPCRQPQQATVGFVFNFATRRWFQTRFEQSAKFVVSVPDGSVERITGASRFDIWERAERVAVGEYKEYFTVFREALRN